MAVSDGNSEFQLRDDEMVRDNDFETTLGVDTNCAPAGARKSRPDKVLIFFSEWIVGIDDGLELRNSGLFNALSCGVIDKIN